MDTCLLLIEKSYRQCSRTLVGFPASGFASDQPGGVEGRGTLAVGAVPCQSRTVGSLGGPWRFGLHEAFGDF